MNSTQAPTRGEVPPERLAEAGVWIAKLHGDARGRTIENGLRRWLQEDPDNARAFELATEVWEDAAQLRRFVSFRSVEPVKARSSLFPVLSLAAVGMLLIVAGVLWFQQIGVIATGVGEQRQLVLEDGTRVFLNTDTRIVVKYDEQVRRVELRRGEALFNVAKRHDWPFIVVAGDRQVKALGTSFIVRKEQENLAVTLVEGSVLVSPAQAVASTGDVVNDVIGAPSASSAGAIEPAPPVTASTLEARSGEFKLTPGQRLTFSSGAPTRIDTPSVEKTTAWWRGQVILDDMPLQAAAAEMNRYNATKLVVEDPEAAALLINGLFQAGDSTHFANAMAHAYGLKVIERGDEIVLSGKPVQ